LLKIILKIVTDLIKRIPYRKRLTFPNNFKEKINDQKPIPVNWGNIDQRGNIDQNVTGALCDITV